MKLPTRVTEWEVGTRDGFQIESGADIRLSRGGRPAGRVASAQVLLSFVMLASFVSPAGGDSTVLRQRERFPANANQLAQSADGQQQFDEGQAAFNRGDYAAAFRAWTPLAKQGHTKAQEKLGTMYYEGRGVARDYAEAFGWFRRAADQGDPNAPFYLGVMYHDGLGVTKDRAEAARWYRRAAEQGTAVAQVNLGAAYADGDGVSRDDAEAVRWYRKAAEQGHALGQNNLAYMYETGRGVAQDRGQALMWYRKAAAQGNSLAKNNLKRLEAEGGAGALPAAGGVPLRDAKYDYLCVDADSIRTEATGWTVFRMTYCSGMHGGEPARPLNFAVDCAEFRSTGNVKIQLYTVRWEPTEAPDRVDWLATQLVCEK
jgi:TPR repeat protein